MVYRELDGSYLCFLASKSHLSVCQEKIYKLQWHLANGWNTVFCHVVYGLTRIHSRPICRFDVSSLLWMTNRLSRNVYVNVVRPNSIGTALLLCTYVYFTVSIKSPVLLNDLVWFFSKSIYQTTRSISEKKINRSVLFQGRHGQFLVSIKRPGWTVGKSLYQTTSTIFYFKF